MKKLTILTGAGISAESGITTFRDSGGLWEQYDVMEVASIDGWYKNPQLVLQFYNQRRSQLKNVEPNEAHTTLAGLQQYFDVQIITQNIDNLHERAGSKNVLHLHGELTKAQSSKTPSMIQDIGYNTIEWGDTAPDGSQLRPHIVWFGEAVPLIADAAEMVVAADILVIIGSSLNVYPAAGLINHARKHVPIYLIDPNEVAVSKHLNVHIIQDKATKGTAELKNILLKSIL